MFYNVPNTRCLLGIEWKGWDSMNWGARFFIRKVGSGIGSTEKGTTVNTSQNWGCSAKPFHFDLRVITSTLFFCEISQAETGSQK